MTHRFGLARTEHLYTKSQPDPDLVIRTSGEQRLGGFLLCFTTEDSERGVLPVLSLTVPSPWGCHNREMNVMAVAADQEPHIGWWSVGWGVFMVFVALGARRRFLNGYGEGGAALARRGQWGAFLSRAGFAMVPIAWAMGALALAAAFMKLAFETSDAFIAPAILSVLALISALGWAAKEFVRPNKHAMQPIWMDDYLDERRRMGR